jgi:hypothetical protein
MSGTFISIGSGGLNFDYLPSPDLITRDTLRITISSAVPGRRESPGKNKIPHFLKKIFYE